MKDEMKVAVIGAGVAGLAATKCLTEKGAGFQCVTFEQTNSVGGTWVYTDNVGTDENGLHVHSSMYQGLRTNLPKDIMGLPGYPFKGKTENSYVSSEEVLDYLLEYTEHFRLNNYIKFCHHVKNITPLEDEKWKITVVDLKNKKEDTYYFDAVFVCVGFPNYPNIDGRDTFKGVQIHSHDYKSAAPFEGKNVMVMGAGASALDIANQVAQIARQVYLSSHDKKVANVEFPENVIKKPDPGTIKENSVMFTDSLENDVDAIIYCTGYEYEYPFLSPECGIQVVDKIIENLYKFLINIEHPTMAFLGILNYCPRFEMVDLQIKIFMKILKGEVVLPSKDAMLQETRADIEGSLKSRRRAKYYTMGRENTQAYFDSLSLLGNLPKTKKIVLDIYYDGVDRLYRNFQHFRKGVYHIVDEEHFQIEE